MTEFQNARSRLTSKMAASRLLFVLLYIILTANEGNIFKRATSKSTEAVRNMFQQGWFMFSCVYNNPV